MYNEQPDIGFIMALSIMIYIFSGLLISASLIAFAIVSVKERRITATLRSIILVIAVIVGWTGWYFLVGSETFWLFLPPVVVMSGLVLFFIPLGQIKPLAIGKITERVDERDTVFAREEYLPGSEKYDRYYSTHPELREVDDRIRRLPELLEPGGRYYDEAPAGSARADFREIEDMTSRVDGKVTSPPAPADPDWMTAWVKEELLSARADEVGIAKLNPMYVYSHVGRGPEPWGQPIENRHKYAIVFTLEMNYHEVETAPHLSITRETARKYKQAAVVSINLAKQIRELGYPARAHIAGSNYHLMLPPVACDAGLGELGRMGYLISPRLGARVRLGAITTDLQLQTDRPVTFGVQDFCDKCLKCAINCPSGAIPSGPKTDIRGVEKWALHVERCIHYWRVIGTDCGLCMKVCPYSHPPTFFHNLVRAGCRRSSFARRVAVWGDDFFYGRKLRLPG